MNRLIIKIVMAIAIGVLIGVVSGNLESNKQITYFFDGKEISKESYDIFMKVVKDEGSGDDYIVRAINKKVSFNKDLGFYYGAFASSSLIILLLIPSLIKKQDD